MHYQQCFSHHHGCCWTIWRSHLLHSLHHIYNTSTAYYNQENDAFFKFILVFSSMLEIPAEWSLLTILAGLGPCWTEFLHHCGASAPILQDGMGPQPEVVLQDARSKWAQILVLFFVDLYWVSAFPRWDHNSQADDNMISLGGPMIHCQCCCKRHPTGGTCCNLGTDWFSLLFSGTKSHGYWCHQAYYESTGVPWPQSCAYGGRGLEFIRPLEDSKTRNNAFHRAEHPCHGCSGQQMLLNTLTSMLSKTLPGLVITKILMHRFAVTLITKKSVNSLSMRQWSVSPTLLRFQVTQMSLARKMIDWNQERLLITLHGPMLSLLVNFQLCPIPVGHLPWLLLPFTFHLAFLTLLTGHEVVQLCLIFKPVWDSLNPFSNMFFIYVLHFTTLQPDPYAGMHVLKQVLQNTGKHAGDIIPLFQICSLVHLIPHFGQKMNPQLQSWSSNKLSSSFWLNKYWTKELFHCCSP